MTKLFLLMAVAVSACTSNLPASDSVGVPLISAERQAEIEKPDFDACALTSPEETWVYWDVFLSEEDKKQVGATPYSDLILFHLGWGMGIRNEFCLWKGGPLRDWFAARGVEHPDDMSHILIELYWAHLNGCRPDADAFARSPDIEHLRCK